MIEVVTPSHAADRYRATNLIPASPRIVLHATSSISKAPLARLCMMLLDIQDWETVRRRSYPNYPVYLDFYTCRSRHRVLPLASNSSDCPRDHRERTLLTLGPTRTGREDKYVPRCVVDE